MSCFIGLLLAGVIVIVPPALTEKSYNVELNSFEVSEQYGDGNKWVDWDTLRMKKVGRNKFTLAGNFEVNLNIGDEQKLSLKVYTYNSVTRRKGIPVLNMKKPFCKFISEDKDTYPHLQPKSNLPEAGVCPFPKGRYTINDYELETTFLPNETPKGDYLVEFSIMDKDVGVTGLTGTITLT